MVEMMAGNTSISPVDERVQRVAFQANWVTEYNKYQTNSVGTARISQDAQWLAIVRFCKDVKEEEKAKLTVEEVIKKAAEIKGCSFDAWKGSQANSTSNEAQHLVPASVGMAERWPYEWINDARNGKMLLAGRQGKGVDTEQDYKNAKMARMSWYEWLFASDAGQPARGMVHIRSGISHPKYSAMVKEYIADYKKAKCRVGTRSMKKEQAYEIMDKLREWHKEEDRKTAFKSIEDKAETSPLTYEEPKTSCVIL
jgi:hypothetical protein